jgi:hypothetical protein
MAAGLLTYSMEHSPSWEVDQSLQLVKKFPAFLWNPKVPHRTHKCPPPVLILSQLRPIPTTPSNFLKIHLNIIFPSTSGSSQWPLSLRLPHPHPVHTRHMTCPSHSSRFLLSRHDKSTKGHLDISAQGALETANTVFERWKIAGKHANALIGFCILHKGE